MAKTLQVVTEIVNHELCCGCGVCAAACPSGNLTMAWQDNGDLAPQLLNECPSECSVCMKVCPFGLQANSESRLAKARFNDFNNIKQDESIGYYLASFVGYSLYGGHRKLGASGGMATWLLEKLLDKRLVDAVICVMPGTTGEYLFEYNIVTEIENLRNAAGSRYYPVNLARVLSIIIEGDPLKRYAVVGLPCVLKGLYLAIETIPGLGRRIAYTLGLTCGHLPNRYYTEYLSYLSGVSPDTVMTTHYRRKDKTTRAGDFKFRAFSKDGESGVDIPFSKISNIWGDGYFQVNACNYCDDVFAEVADATFMDAWLPEYEKDPLGHSIVVVRHPELLTLFREGDRDGTSYLKLLPVSRVKDSQQGVITNKKILVGARLYAAYLKGKKIPEIRCKPDAALYKKQRVIVETRFTIQQVSKYLWPMYSSTKTAKFRRHLFLLSLPLLWQRMGVRVRRVITNPLLILKFLRS